ncbi:MAG: hypothetical protein P9X27_06720 [Candidatus Kaelpia aquatica]|nr:hypothetical protein [Candidatus Kaelpia aquatica]
MNRIKIFLSSIVLIVFSISLINPSIFFQSLSSMRRERVLPVDSYLDFVENTTASRVDEEIRRNPAYIRIRGGHLNHSRNLILKAAEIALEDHNSGEPKRVLVIGAGSCLDIPIKELTQMFDEVYLLDIAYKTTAAIAEEGRYFDLVREDGEWQAVENYLSAEERSKIKFVLSDATGGAVFEIVGRLEELLQSEVITKDDVLGLLDGLTLSQLPFEGGYFDFISSSTVFSEFLNLVENYIMVRLDDRDASFYVNDINVGETLIRLNEDMGRFHVREAYRMLNDSGRLYLSAARFIGEVFTPIGNIDGKAGEFLPQSSFIRHLVREISMPEDLTTLVSDHFSIFPQEQPDLSSWLWPIDNDTAIGVQAVVLAKREYSIPLNGDEELSLTSGLIETIGNIYVYGNSFKDRAGHFITTIPDHLLNEGLYILNRRLDHLIRDELRNDEIDFGDSFVPHLYATSLTLINRRDLRNIFLGDDLGSINTVSLNGKITLTRLMRISNGTYLNNVDFKAAVYVGSGWVLEDVYAERSVFSASMTDEETILSNTSIVNSYIGFGADINASSIKNTIIPEGRVLRAEAIGLMGEEKALAEYLSLVHEELDIQRLLSGDIRVPGSDIDNLSHAGRITSLAAAFCLLLQQSEVYLVDNYIDSLPQEVESMVRDRMSIVSVFIDHSLYETINGP